MRYFTATNTELPKTVVKAAFALKKTGSVVGPIDGGDGNFYILKQTGHRKALDKSFEDVERQIRNRLYRQKRTQAQKDYVAELKTKAKIKTFEEALSKVQIDTSGAATNGHGHGHSANPGPSSTQAAGEKHGHGPDKSHGPGENQDHGTKGHSHAPDTAGKTPEATP